MVRVACPGSFDPPTLGHLDVIARAAAVADEVVVVVVANPAKRGLFTPSERVELLAAATAGLPNVSVETFHGLLVDFCRERGVVAVVKGLRGVGDLDHELSMAQMNRHLTGLESMFVASDPRYAFVSSSLVKDVANHGGDVSAFVPQQVHDRLLTRLAELRVSP